ncbi:MAG: glycoside hydrolase family 65 protein [Thermoleophilaceae bacterium]|nr:glycoside hydrolase family 65 protein [Thermoleophilaceae bacterium]
MSSHPRFAVDPWAVRETTLALEELGQTESVFALSNGHIGLRGNLDEGEPHARPGTYLNGFHELRPLPYAEAGYGYPESGQTVVNVTDGKILRLLVDDELFDVRYGQLRSHVRELDLRGGVLRREVDWVSPAGKAVRISSVRLVSFVHRGVAAVRYVVEPLGADARVVVQSELVANEPLPAPDGDPRAAAALSAPLEAESWGHGETSALLSHITRASGLRVTAGMDHVVSGPDGIGLAAETSGDLGRVTVAANLRTGQHLDIVKFLAYGWSAARSLPAVRAQVAAALTEARHTGWDGFVAGQADYLEEFWAGADVEVDGDPEIQQAVRFGLFHVLQAGARAEGRAIPGKGLTGPGYDGHAFWDTESFVLPVLTYTRPAAARDALRWRHSTLPAARGRAGELGLAGAAFPWRTIAGEECSGYWPAGTAAFHVAADIADAVERYRHATGDEEFERESGLELLVETARLWCSLGHYDHRGGFRIDGVTGPDEYSAVADNNVYTNLMAQRNLRAAAASAERHPDLSSGLGVDDREIARWREAAEAVVVPYDEALGVHSQAEDFTQHAEWDFDATFPSQYPLFRSFPYFELYRKQVVKQADLVLALHARGDAFTDEEKARNFAYYEARTLRDSSLSACTQAVVAAEVGHLELAYDYLGAAALMDLHDLQSNTRDGVHMASLAGGWIGLVAGFGGMRDHDGKLAFHPRLPRALTRLSFVLGVRGRRLRVEVGPEAATYSVEAGAALSITHHGEPIEVAADRPATRAIPPAPERPRPAQPPGREPPRRA